jgi:predicted  nucleic acid-binding Zn-ribbon protein
MLDTLNQVQALDLQLDTLNAEKDDVPPELIEVQSQKRDLDRQLERKLQEREGLRKRVSSTELELQDLSARRKSASESSLRAQSAKEASQFQNQEIQFATRVQEVEDDLMPLMEAFEVASDEASALEEQIAELLPSLEELERDERARVETVEERIVNVSATRTSLAESIDRPLLKQYEQVRRARRGVGLVEIKERSRCGGCNVKLPIHVVQKARRGKGVTRCPSCGRILWNRESDDG